MARLRNNHEDLLERGEFPGDVLSSHRADLATITGEQLTEDDVAGNASEFGKSWFWIPRIPDMQRW